MKKDIDILKHMEEDVIDILNFIVDYNLESFSKKRFNKTQKPHSTPSPRNQLHSLNSEDLKGTETNSKRQEKLIGKGEEQEMGYWVQGYSKNTSYG